MMAAGLFLLGFGVYGLHEDIHWVAQPFYAWVWWGYILTLDGFSRFLTGDSLLTTRLRFVLPICLWSITFWFFFELINVRIQNWYYVGVFPDEAIVSTVVFTLLAFSTVFMGIFETYDALFAAGLWRRWIGKPRCFTIRLTYVLQGIGIVLGAAALLFPYYLAPLVWGCFTLIVDPWNYRRGTRSLLRDLENGDYGLIARLLLAGLICGVVWESLNFFAPQKWIYTVRGLEGFKIFEMPMLGFLGFPALALDSMAAFALFASFFLGNRTWERPDGLRYSLSIHAMPKPRRFRISLVFHAAFWMAMSYWATPYNVGSYLVRLSDLGVSRSEQSRLMELGITRPRQLIRSARKPGMRQRLQEELDWTDDRLTAMNDRARLYTFKGIGQRHGSLLERAGVHSPNDLRGMEVESLHRELKRLAEAHGQTPPSRDMVRVWALAARNLP